MFNANSVTKLNNVNFACAWASCCQLRSHALLLRRRVHVHCEWQRRSRICGHYLCANIMCAVCVCGCVAQHRSARQGLARLVRSGSMEARRLRSLLARSQSKAERFAQTRNASLTSCWHSQLGQTVSTTGAATISVNGNQQTVTLLFTPATTRSACPAFAFLRG